MSNAIATNQHLVPAPGAPTLKKAAQVVLSRERGDLQLVDRKLFSFLLLRSYRDLKEKQVHKVPIQDALAYLKHTSTVPLHESLERLGTVTVEIDYVDQADVSHSVRAHFLSYDMSRTESGAIHFAFDPILLQHLFEPRVFATIDMNFLRSFRSNYAAKLYEIMEMYKKRFNPLWSVSVDTLREILGIRPGQHPRFDNLRTKVIERAVAEINEIAEFDVSVEYVRGGRGGKVVEVRFRTAPKAHPDVVAPPSLADPLGRGRRVARDENTVDLLDGQTDAERGGPASLQVTTRQKAAEMAGADGDVDTYEQEWREEMRGRRVRDPDNSFLTWLGLRLERERDALLLDLDPDAFGTLLERLD